MFAFVLKKFFTDCRESENNTATYIKEDAMLKEFKSILSRAGSSAVEDTLGVISLFALLFAALSISGTV